MGVWIEIVASAFYDKDKNVTPCVGVWIEIRSIIITLYYLVVTPCVGVWIEIIQNNLSHQFSPRHSLRGSVD